MALVNYDSSCSSDDSIDDCDKISFKTSNQGDKVKEPKSKIARLTQPIKPKK